MPREGNGRQTDMSSGAGAVVGEKKTHSESGEKTLDGRETAG